MKLYVSFGQKWNLKDCFMVFQDMTEIQVRKYMIARYDNQYAFIYTEEEALPQIEKYGLSLVEPGATLHERF